MYQFLFTYCYCVEIHDQDILGFGLYRGCLASSIEGDLVPR